MESSRIALGAVFRWPHDERPGRILVYDGSVVMYDSWWPHLSNWGLADLSESRRGIVNYYVTTSSVVAMKASYLREAPISPEEASLHRPDLPFAVMREQRLTWPVQASEISAFSGSFPADQHVLSAPEVYLSPFGPKGGLKKGIRISAEDKTGFTAQELMRKAADLQVAHSGRVGAVVGVGIYRLGLCWGRPAFYLRGATPEHEVD
ncbi:hypothetical protein GCM10010172_16250 [Paractinoplanes ferrugineus]|uniref:Uncharacterized protein n=1 Tax=Paractinoplanes ferrugineus TaxID=113564 RepID=A0A919MD45_9ACTN|nr:hypothetical protein [Actinoplanes ferrugineus]GIE10189.1 hypothetical protein Afe05nite_20290 [Actinoplanes ferrugineus]